LGKCLAPIFAVPAAVDDAVVESTLHNYQSEADRANDALLITEVKHTRHDGVTAHRAVVVDCDQGTILLSGIVGSSEDASMLLRWRMSE
jgi:hypothetical protein